MLHTLRALLPAYNIYYNENEARRPEGQRHWQISLAAQLARVYQKSVESVAINTAKRTVKPMRSNLAVRTVASC